MRSLTELTTTDEPAWSWIQELVAAAPSAQLLPRDPARADEALLAMQITVRSPLGALVHGSGGLLVDQGWLRLLGSGSAHLTRSVPAWKTNGSGLLPSRSSTSRSAGPAGNRTSRRWVAIKRS